MFMNSGNAHMTVSLCSSLALVGMTDGMEGVSVAVEWQPRCVLETEGRTNGRSGRLFIQLLSRRRRRAITRPARQSDRERAKEGGSEWNRMAAANELCGKKGIWMEDMGWEGGALLSVLLTRLPSP